MHLENSAVHRRSLFHVCTTLSFTPAAALADAEAPPVFAMRSKSFGVDSNLSPSFQWKNPRGKFISQSARSSPSRPPSLADAMEVSTMNKTLIAALIPFALLGTSPAFSATQATPNCAAQLKDIEAQIATIKEHSGSIGKFTGMQQTLEQLLAQAKALCTGTDDTAPVGAKAGDKQADASPAQTEVH
ncbi:hypothetical protein [Trinickia sp. YCB016]